MKGPYNVRNPLTDEGRNQMNTMFQELYAQYVEAGLNAKEAREKAVQAVADSVLAKDLAETTRQEMLEIIREQTRNGDLAPEIAQARGGKATIGERFNSIDSDLAQTEQELDVVDNKATDALAKAENPLAALSQAGHKISLSDLSNEVKEAMSGTTGITTAQGYFENNRGVDFPLKPVTFRGDIQPVGGYSKNVILDAKVFGAKVDCYYVLSYIANGRESNGKARWGVTLVEYVKSTFATNPTHRFIFIYNDDTLLGNEGNANWTRQSNGIETITLDNGEIAASITIDRSVIDRGEAGFTTHLTVIQDSPTAIIDPANYFF